MEKLFNYPPEGWKSESNKRASFLALAMHKVASQLGVNAEIYNAPEIYALGNDIVVMFEGVRLELNNQEYGCSLEVVIMSEKNIKVDFFVLWKFFVDKGLFWGGPYKKDLIEKHTKDQKQEPITIEKPWELIRGEDQHMIDLVRLWCTTNMTGAEIAEKISIGETTLSNYLSDLRVKYPRARIPKGLKERTEYRIKWLRENNIID